MPVHARFPLHRKYGRPPEVSESRIQVSRLAHCLCCSTRLTQRDLPFSVSPRLKTPPPLSPEGQPIKPVVEKSFIQKYWMYIVPVLILLRKLSCTPPFPNPRVLSLITYHSHTPCVLVVMPAGPEEGGQQS